ncbi:hypothetical protein J4455_00495 [Candidatus Woesearchaeota archaeon]|nr:hypothetical protein [Candidatus Woesearchaeota archaeon]
MNNSLKRTFYLVPLIFNLSCSNELQKPTKVVFDITQQFQETDLRDLIKIDKRIYQEGLDYLTNKLEKYDFKDFDYRTTNPLDYLLSMYARVNNQEINLSTAINFIRAINSNSDNQISFEEYSYSIDSLLLLAEERGIL